MRQIAALKNDLHQHQAILLAASEIQRAGCGRSRSDRHWRWRRSPCSRCCCWWRCRQFSLEDSHELEVHREISGQHEVDELLSNFGVHGESERRKNVAAGLRGHHAESAADVK